jgi:hypothetical protein
MKRVASVLVCLAGLVVSLPSLAAEGAPPTATVKTSATAAVPVPNALAAVKTSATAAVPVPNGLFAPPDSGQASQPIWLDAQCVLACRSCPKSCCSAQNDPPAPIICFCC